MKISVLHVITGLNTGGAERMLVKLIKYTKKEVSHRVISLKDKGTQGAFIEELGVPIDTLGLKGSVVSLNKIIRLRKLINKNRPDLIQGWMYHGNLATIVTGFSIPIVFNIRHSLSDIGYEKRMTRLMIKLNSLLSYKVAKVIYNSRQSQMEHENYGFSPSASFVLPNGFDIAKFYPNEVYREEMRDNLHINSDIILFGQIGRNHPMKNFMGLVYAAAKVIHHSQKCHFILVGRNVDADKKIKRLISELGISENVTLLGQRIDIPKIWNAVDFGILASSWGEGFPNVVGEAMACGTPCVVTDVGDSGYVVGKTGIVVPPMNINELSQAILKLSNLSKKDREEMGEKARKRIVHKFSMRKVANDYVELYKDVLRTKCDNENLY